jgi:hypothetical protein
MSNIEDDQRSLPPLPDDLPKCGCFSSETGDDVKFAWDRCVDVSRASNVMADAFRQMVVAEQFCPTAMPFFLEIATLSILTFIAKAQGPALEYGTQEIEWEVERLLGGLETRVLARSRETYAKAREAGITVEVVRAMREREDGDGGTVQ